MKRLTNLLLPWLAVFLLAQGVSAQTGGDAAELTTLLKEFLTGASRNDAAMHDRFWAEDLIYTGSSGRRISKQDIMRDTRSAPSATPGDPRPTYTAEDIRIQQYGDTAIVAFRLVATTNSGDVSDVQSYLNTGTFLKRQGKWQAVSWQATRMPRAEEEGKKQVAAAEAALHRAMLSADVNKLKLLLDESFVWTHTDGRQMTRAELLDQLGSGRLKYSKLETASVTVSVSGDTAVVRGSSPRQRSSFPGAEGKGDPAPFTAFYTLTFVNKGGSWKAIAMHTSRASEK
jgi:uncharacterized protein DUF4440